MPDMKDEEEAKAIPKTDKKLECVFVKKGNKSKIRIITTGIQDDTNIEVLTGIKKGDTIIIGPYNTVKELNSNDAIFIKESGEKSKKEN
jgi:HlyD family secretion protein